MSASYNSIHVCFCQKLSDIMLKNTVFTHYYATKAEHQTLKNKYFNLHFLPQIKSKA